MDCRNAEYQLLQTDALSLDGLWPEELADHVTICGACRQRLADLSSLEQAWRAIPLPDGSERASEAFLDHLARQATRRRRARLLASRWLVAASVVLALGVVGGLLVPLRTEASADVIERLVDWNLSLARTPSPVDRDRLYENQAAGLKAEVLMARLPRGDRGFAQSLLETAPWLARNEDPLAEADRFNDVADQLIIRMNLATRGGDHNRVERYVRLFRRVQELGIESKLDLLEASGALDFDRERRLERLILRDANRMHALVSLLERAPDSSRKEIKLALKSARQYPKNRRRAGKREADAASTRAIRNAPGGTGRK